MLIRNAHAIFTGLAGAGGIAAGSIRIEGSVIAEVGELVPKANEQVFDATDCVVAPGWVNTHHHFFQSLLKAIPAGIDKPLRQWSPAVAAPYRGAFTEALFRTAVQVALAELVLSGCTTCADHHFLYYPGLPFDGAAILFEEADRFGVRLVLCRGGMTVAPPSEGALPAWLVPETIDAYVEDVERLAAAYHDASLRSRRRIAVAPTTLASRVRPEHLRILADTARRLKLHLHSHFAETDDDEDWCREHYGCSLIDLCDDNGWLGPDAWFAHMVRLRPEDVRRLGAAGVGMAHCPASNARLGSGIAPVMELEASGVRIGMGVDGAGSNESAEMLSELHFAWLVHRTRAETTDDGSLRSPSSADLMRWATSGGADILGLETGRIAAGWPADLAVYRPTEAGHLGLHDPSSCLVVTAARPGVELVLCDGRALVKQGTLVATDFAELRARAMRAMAQLRQTQ